MRNKPYKHGLWSLYDLAKHREQSMDTPDTCDRAPQSSWPIRWPTPRWGINLRCAAFVLSRIPAGTHRRKLWITYRRCGWVKYQNAIGFNDFGSIKDDSLASEGGAARGRCWQRSNNNGRLLYWSHEKDAKWCMSLYRLLGFTIDTKDIACAYDSKTGCLEARAESGCVIHRCGRAGQFQIACYLGLQRLVRCTLILIVLHVLQVLEGCLADKVAIRVWIIRCRTCFHWQNVRLPVLRNR